MTLIPFSDAPSREELAEYTAGYLSVKNAADATPVYSLSGRLYASGDWILLSVPNAVVRGLFDALDEPGVELPPGHGNKLFNAHISVMRPEEVAQLGGIDKITERGHMFRYQVGALKTVTPMGWKAYSKVWFLSINSPELQALRKSYGLSGLPMRGDTELPFHATVAVRRKSVLYANERSKAALHDESPIHRLREAKRRSDVGDYAGKHALIQEMMQEAPDDWEVDDGQVMAGVTHKPTKFRMHMPRKKLVNGVKAAFRAGTSNHDLLADFQAYFEQKLKANGVTPRDDDNYKERHEYDKKKAQLLKELTALVESRDFANLKAPHALRKEGGMRYLPQAFASEPIRWDTQSGIVQNLFNHLGKVQARGARALSDSESVQRIRSSWNPAYGRDQFMRTLRGTAKPQVSQAEQMMLGFPLQQLGTAFK